MLQLHTGGQESVTDLTDQCARFLREVGAQDGLLHVFVPHATAGVAILEVGAGSDEDLLAALTALLPSTGPHRSGWRHRHGTPGHGRDHVVPALVSPATSIPVLDGELALGQWQSVVLLDTNVDNLTRDVRLSFLPG